jgi:hypothetical protein
MLHCSEEILRIYGLDPTNGMPDYSQHASPRFGFLQGIRHANQVR